MHRRLGLGIIGLFILAVGSSPRASAQDSQDTPATNYQYQPPPPPPDDSYDFQGSTPPTDSQDDDGAPDDNFQPPPPPPPPGSAENQAPQYYQPPGFETMGKKMGKGKIHFKLVKDEYWEPGKKRPRGIIRSQ